MLYERLQTIGVLTLVLLIAWYIHHFIRPARSRGRPPLAPYYLPFGLDTLWQFVVHNIRNADYDFVNKQIARSGSYTFEMQLLGARHIVTVDPENIKALLSTQFNEFGKGSRLNRGWKQFLGDGIFTVDGQVWLESRALLRPQFLKRRISDLHMFEEQASKMISLLPTDGSTIEIEEWFHRLTLDVATEYLFGQSVNSLENPKISFAVAFARLQQIHTRKFLMGPAGFFYHPKDHVPSLKVIDDFIQPFVERAVRGEGRPEKDSGNFTDALSNYTKDRKVLRDQLLNTLIAGRDTTAATLSFLFYELAYHPDVYAKLREEVIKIIGPDARPTYDDLKNMKYLQHCISEALRLYPSVPTNMRTAFVDTTLPRGGGPKGEDPIVVPKGTPCLYYTYVLQRRVDLFGPTVNDFNPARWDTWIPSPWTYIPFNGGPRICIGQDFALTLIAYVVTQMCQAYEKIEERTGLKRGSQGIRFEVFLTPVKGVTIGLIPVKS